MKKYISRVVSLALVLSMVFSSLTVNAVDASSNENEIATIDTENATSVEISQGDSMKGYVGEGVYIMAELQPTDCTSETFTWKSSDETVVSAWGVDEYCYVNFVSAGTATVTVMTSSGLTDQIQIEVCEVPELTIGEDAEVTLSEYGQTACYKFIPSETGTYKFYTKNSVYGNLGGTVCSSDWSELEGSEYIEGQNNIKSIVKLEGGQTYYFRINYYGQVTSAISVAVEQVTQVATGIEITEGDLRYGYVGNTYWFYTELQPTDCIRPESYEWESSDEAVVTVNNHGKSCYVKYLSVGTATVTVTTSNGLTDQIQIEVREKPELTLGVCEDVTMSGTGELYYQFTPSESGAYKFYTTESSFSGIYGSILNENMGYLESTESVDGYNIKAIANLEAGKTYYFRISKYMEGTATFSVSVELITQKMTEITITNGESISRYSGQWIHITAEFEPEDCIPEDITWTSADESVVSFDYYGTNYVNVYCNGVGTTTITVTTQSGLTDSIQITVCEIPEISAGTSIEYTMESSEAYYKFVPEKTDTYMFSAINSSWGPGITLMDENLGYITWANTSLTYEFTEGETYYFSVSAEQGITFQITLKETVAIEKLEIVSYPTQMTYYQGVGAYNYNGLELKATMEDGSEIYWTYYEGMLGDYNVVFSNLYNEETQEYSDVIITCANQSVSFSFNVIENPVASIEVVGGELEPLIENVDGWWTTDTLFIYNYPSDFYDLQIQINYTDGTSKVATMGDYVDGNYFSSSHNQWENAWTVGSDNYITISYVGKTVDVPVTIVENPIERIEVLTTPGREYVWGDEVYGWLSDAGIYYLYPSDFSGLSFTIYYKDGTQKTYTDEEISAYGEIDGEYLQLKQLQLESTGEYSVSCSYMGCALEYDVKVVDSEVASIEVVQDPLVTKYDNRYNPDFTGMKIRITYNDGTSEVVEVTEENTRNDWGYYYVTVGDNEISIMPDEYYYISYLGAKCVYDGIEFYEGKAIETIDIPNISMSGNDITVQVTYEDGSTESVTLEFVEYYAEDSYFEGYAKTDNGFLSCWIDKYKENDTVEYYVYIFGEEFIIEASDVMYGDANGDGQVTTVDLAMIRSYLANKNPITGESTIAVRTGADVNGDGTVTTVDLAMLRAYLANKNPITGESSIILGPQS